MFKRIVTIILCVVLGAGILVAYNNYRSAETQKADELHEIYSQLTPIEEKIKKLTAQRAELTKMLGEQNDTVFTAQLVFTECPTELYDEVYPLMKDAGLTGIIALNESEFFRFAGRINYTMYADMVKNGWMPCISWDGVTDIAEFIGIVNHNIEVFGFEAANVVYFPENSYLDEYAHILSENGIIAAICEGEAETQLTDEGLWIIGAEPISYTDIQNQLSGAIEAGGNKAYTVSFTGNNAYNKKGFTAFVNILSALVEEESMSVADVQTAFEVQQEMIMANEAAVKALEQEIAKVDNELADSRKQLEDIYSLWNGR